MNLASSSQHCDILARFSKLFEDCMQMKFNNLLSLYIFRRSVYWDNNFAKNWDNIEPTKSGNVYFLDLNKCYTTEKNAARFFRNS